MPTYLNSGPNTYVIRDLNGNKQPIGPNEVAQTYEELNLSNYPGVTRTSRVPRWNPATKINALSFAGAGNTLIALQAATKKIRLQMVSTGDVMDLYLHDEWKIEFNSGGTQQLQVGDVVTDATSAGTAIVVAVVVTSGTWAGGDAAGYILVESISGTIATGHNLNANVGEATEFLNICTMTTNPAPNPDNQVISDLPENAPLGYGDVELDGYARHVIVGAAAASTCQLVELR